MRTRKSLERLATAGRPLLAAADALADSGEQERILERIVASNRAMPVGHSRRRRRGLALAGAAIVAATAAVAAAGVLGHSPARKAGGHDRVALTGARIQLAGYHFRTPAGFKPTSEPSCGGQGPNPTVDGFNAAASAAGGCVGVAFLRAGKPTGLTATPAGEPVPVGSYQGYYASQSDSNQSSLYVALPKTDPTNAQAYLVLFADRLSEDQVIAVAKSGLADIPFAPTTTTGTEGSG